MAADRSRALRRTLHAGRLAALALAAACAAPEEPAGGDPLLDGAHHPDIMVEASVLEAPPATGGNRFLTGWSPARPRGRPGGAAQSGGPDERKELAVQQAELPAPSKEALDLSPAPGGARLEIVQLAPRSRRLTLDLRLTGAATEGSLRARAAGRDLGIFGVGPRVEVPLPDDLPIGRVAVDLVVDRPGIAVDRAELADALPAGAVEVDGEDIVQAGDSIVDLVRDVPAGASLAGELVPPAPAADGQRFELLLQREGGAAQAAWTWPPDGRRSSRRPARLEVPLGGAGRVRIRLAAHGAGAPARWRHLRLLRTTSTSPRSTATTASASTAIEAAPASTPAGAPVPAPPAPRLVVVVVLDALRADHVGHLAGAGESAPVATPVIDRLAAEGATFRRHFSVAPNTRPSTKTLLTGMVFVTLGGRKLPPDGPATLPELFARAGYHTALVTGNGYITGPSGLARGFEHAPRETRFSPSGGRRGGGATHNVSAERVNAGALAWLDSLPPDHRAFLLLQPVVPHNPYAPPEPHRSRFTAGIRSAIDGSTRTLLAIRQLRRDLTAADEERLRGLYAGNLAHADAELGRLVGELERRYPRQEILLAVTSDHGEELFDHGGVLHGYTLYDEQVHIPLVVRWPARIAPRSVEGATDTSDLHATLAALVERTGANDRPDVARPEVAGTPGRSLWPALTGGDFAGREVVFAAASNVAGGIFMARSERFKLIYAPRTGRYWGMGEGRGRNHEPELLFDLAADPGEQRNLAGDDHLEAAWLRSLLFAWVETGKRQEVAGAEGEMDEATRENLRELGYVE